MTTPAPIYGLLAEFPTPEALIAAGRKTTESGYTRTDAFTPFPVDGLAQAMEFGKTRVPLVVLIGGICGAVGGYFMLYYACKISYPINVGGRPLNSWPAFIPITFEMMVLFAGLSAVFGMIALNGLPTPYHPVFNVPSFQFASRDRFFILIESADRQFNLTETADFLRQIGAIDVQQVPA